MADVFARAAVRTTVMQKPFFSDLGDREKRSATVKKLRICTKILDKLELGEKKTSSRGLVFCTLPPPKTEKTSPRGTCFFHPFPQKRKNKSPGDLLPKSPKSPY